MDRDSGLLHIDQTRLLFIVRLKAVHFVSFPDIKFHQNRCNIFTAYTALRRTNSVTGSVCIGNHVITPALTVNSSFIYHRDNFTRRHANKQTRSVASPRWRRCKTGRERVCCTAALFLTTVYAFFSRLVCCRHQPCCASSRDTVSSTAPCLPLCSLESAMMPM